MSHRGINLDYPLSLPPNPYPRCRVYSLREVDRLEVQKIAGRIVPALATTTSLVAGLVALELVKVYTHVNVYLCVCTYVHIGYLSSYRTSWNK
jgi:hypothetical protein